MPRTRTNTVYTFNELSDAAKEKAREWYRDGALDYDWWDFVYDYWQSALDLIGFTDAKISFSGFSSQGDGASFTSGVDFGKVCAFVLGQTDVSEFGDTLTTLDVRQFNERHVDWLWSFDVCNDISYRVIRTSSRYSHENTCKVESDGYSAHDSIDEAMRVFEEDLEELRRDLCHKIYRSLESGHDYLMSDESVDEMIEANEYEFNEDGSRA